MSLSLLGEQTDFSLLETLLSSFIIFLITGNFLRRSWGNLWMTIDNLPKAAESSLITLLKARTQDKGACLALFRGPCNNEFPWGTASQLWVKVPYGVVELSMEQGVVKHLATGF